MSHLILRDGLGDLNGLPFFGVLMKMILINLLTIVENGMVDYLCFKFFTIKSFD